MRKSFHVTVAMLVVMLVPVLVSAGMLKIAVGYKKGLEKSDNVRVDIKDWYWKFPVVNVPELLKRKSIPLS